MGNVEEYTVPINRKITNVVSLNNFESVFTTKVDEVMCAKNIFENSAEYHPSAQPSTTSDRSVEVEAGNASHIGETRESTCAMGIKTEWEEGTIQGPAENAEITLDYEDGKVCHSTSQYYGTSVFDKDGTNPLVDKIECTIKDKMILFHIDEEGTSMLSNAGNLNIVTAPVPSLKKRKIVEELPEVEEDPYVKSIKTECEEDVHHVSLESTDADIIFGRDGENIECGTNHFEYDLQCKIEETQILFGTEFVPTVQGSSEISNGEDHQNYISNLSTKEKRNSISKHNKCPVCDKRFNLKGNLKLHHRTKHLDLKPYKCHDCDKSFASKSNLSQHQKSRHLKLKPHKCPDCEKSFGAKGNLKVHQASVHLKIKPFKRLDCEKGFYSKSNLSKHQMYQHLKLKPHKCPDCEKSFSTKGNLKVHQAGVHLKVKPFKCPNCNQSFFRKSSMDEHQISQHLRLKLHKCPDCHKSFSTKGNLKVHQGVHLKVKLFKCPDCDKSFVAASLLHKHRTTHQLKLKPHRCPDCDQSFFRKYFMDEHHISKHLKLKPHKCPDCDISFTTKRSLMRHQKSKHFN